jgi:hypothetical protein
MIRIIVMAILVAQLYGCDQYRSHPEQQVEDYGVCKSAGMDSYMNAVSEIKCVPPGALKAEHA